MRDATSFQTLETRVVEWCEAQPLVRAAILTSTRAIATAAIDTFSDLDVILVLDRIDPLCDDRRWLSDFGEVLAAWRDSSALERDPPRTCWVTQYADGHKIDFTLWPVALLQQVAQHSVLPDQLDVGYRVLLDKDGLTRTLRRPTHRAHIPLPPSQEQFLELVEEFFLEATYVAKHLWRHDLMPAKFSLDHVMKQGHLRTLLEWHIEIAHDWSLKPGAFGKGLHTLLSPDVYRALEQTYVGAAIDDNWRALFDTIALFRKVGAEVADRLGYQYPRHVDERVTAFVRQVRADPNPAS